jgi:hypothetical protein
MCLAAPGFQSQEKKSPAKTAPKKSPPKALKKKTSPATKPATSAAKKKRATPGASKPAASAAKKRPPSKKGATVSKKGRSKKRVPSWRTGQQAPTRERYQEIQQALVDKGYLQGPATGIWGAESVEALKKFQVDQNLEPSGKLDSLSLITLGLGPRPEAAGASGSNGPAVSQTSQAAPAQTNPKPP